MYPNNTIKLKIDVKADLMLNSMFWNKWLTHFILFKVTLYCLSTYFFTLFFLLESQSKRKHFSFIFLIKVCLNACLLFQCIINS